MQAEILMKTLAEDRPGELLEAFDQALDQGARWRERLERSLTRSNIATTALERCRLHT